MLYKCVLIVDGNYSMPRAYLFPNYNMACDYMHDFFKYEIQMAEENKTSIDHNETFYEDAYCQIMLKNGTKRTFQIVSIGKRIYFKKLEERK